MHYSYPPMEYLVASSTGADPTSLTFLGGLSGVGMMTLLIGMVVVALACGLDKPPNCKF